MEKENIKEIKERQERFLNDFTALLKRPVKEESKDAQNAKQFGEALKWQLRSYVERIYKLDLLSDDFNLSAFLASNVDYPIARWIEQQEKPWLSDKLTIALMGHYSHGKTSVINSLFNQNFPVRSAESTALPAYLSFGKNTDVIRLVDKGGSIQEIRDEKNEAGLLDYKISNNFPFTRFFEYLEKECADPILQELTFIDTPGLANAKQGHSSPTINTLDQVDIVLWCQRADRGFENYSIDFIKDNITNRKLPLYVIFTFADNVRDINDVLKNLLKTAKENGIDIKNHFVYGNNTELIKTFVSSFKTQAKSISDQYDKFVPMAHIYAIAKQFFDLLSNAQKEAKKARANLNNEQDSIINRYKKSQESFNVEWNNVIRRFNNMVATFNNRCASAMFCGGAASALSSDINHISSSINEMGRAFAEIDDKDLVALGQIAGYINDLEEKEKAMESLKQEIKSNILNIFE